MFIYLLVLAVVGLAFSYKINNVIVNEGNAVKFVLLKIIQWGIGANSLAYLVYFFTVMKL